MHNCTQGKWLWVIFLLYTGVERSNRIGCAAEYKVHSIKYQDTKYPTGLVAQRIRLCQWLHFRFHHSCLVPTQYSEVMQNKLELAALVLLLCNVSISKSLRMNKTQRQLCKRLAGPFIPIKQKQVFPREIKEDQHIMDLSDENTE